MQQIVLQGFLDNEMQVRNLINRIVNEFTYIEDKTLNSLKSFVNFLDTKNPSSLADFRTFWGRGQQYLCFENDLECI